MQVKFVWWNYNIIIQLHHRKDVQAVETKSSEWLFTSVFQWSGADIKEIDRHNQYKFSMHWYLIFSEIKFTRIRKILVSDIF